MAFTIDFDFRFDSAGFFDNPAAREALRAAAAVWEGLILDEFEDVPAGIAFDIDDPSAPGRMRRVELETPIDDILVFVGAADLGGPLAEAGPGGIGLDGFAIGDVFDRRVASDFRGLGPVTDVEPWAGTITFSSTAAWSFSAAAPVAGRNDFFTIALHELAHVLGISTLGAFETLVEGGRFLGANARALTGGAGIPLDGTLHVVDGHLGDSVLMDPTVTVGRRKLPTPTDLAMLADIGYAIAGFAAQGSQPSLATEGDDGIIFGTAVADLIDGLGGAEQIQGEAGDDTLLGGAGDDTLLGLDGDDRLEGGEGADQLQGGSGDDLLIGGAGPDVLFGDAGRDVFAVGPGGGIDQVLDFTPGTDLLLISPAFGLATAAAVLATVTKPFANLSRLALPAGTVVEIAHPAQAGSPLTLRDIAIGDPSGLVVGTAGDDRGLAGSDGDDAILGLDGDDAILGSDGSDRIDGGAGTDRVIYAGPRGVFVPRLGADGTVTVAKPGGGIDRLSGIERIDLEDGDFLYDLFGFGETLALGYRLYAAAFARTPDEAGLRFWIGRLDAGLSARDAARAFIASAEFAARYGTDPDDTDYVTALYANVLGRPPDPDGLAFWTDAFASGALDRAGMLVEFAASRENVAATRPVLDDGVFVTAPDFDPLA